MCGKTEMISNGHYQRSVPDLDQQFLLGTWKMSMPCWTFRWACGICSQAILDDVFYFLTTLQSEEGSNCAEQLNDVILLNTRTIWCFLILTLWHIFASCNDMPTLFCIVFSPLVVAMLFSQGYFTREMKSKALRYC